MILDKRTELLSFVFATWEYLGEERLLAWDVDEEKLRFVGIFEVPRPHDGVIRNDYDIVEYTHRRSSRCEVTEIIWLPPEQGEPAKPAAWKFYNEAVCRMLWDQDTAAYLNAAGRGWTDSSMNEIESEG